MSTNANYIQDNKGKIYKIMPNYYLQVSPWEYGDDRRVYEIDNGNYHTLTYKNVCMIVNKQFANSVEEWDRNGKKYISKPISSNIDEHAALLSMLPSHKIIKQSKNILNTLDGNNSISIFSEDNMSEFKMIKHNGKIYYILVINKFLPRVKMYDTFGKFCQWANVKNCKPIFCETDKRYV